LGKVLEQRKIGAVVYEDVNDPRGLALLTWSEDPSHFVTKVRPALLERELRTMRHRPEYAMLGRTYSGGHEPRLEWQLLDRPRELVLDKEWPWGIWYPLRRTGAFAKLPPHEQNVILREHASIGMSYGAQGLAHDIRLACHGLDAHDNEFVIGLVGRELHPLSHLVQTMRKTRQTSEFISQMGPFFVGYAAYHSAG
jgi:chlorite dismutase